MAAAGRVVTTSSLAIESVYEIKEDVSLKTGNIDFNGTVIIRGDVPTGFSIKASGDILIDGLVEAAHIEAKGSVTIVKGIVGSRTGGIIAGGKMFLWKFKEPFFRNQILLLENIIKLL